MKLSRGISVEVQYPCHPEFLPFSFTGPEARESGGIGRRAGFRTPWGNPWGFESPLSHQVAETVLRQWAAVRRITGKTAEGGVT